MVSGKVWGSTQQIIMTPTFELHRIEVNAGHRCSKHRHLHKYNAFFVEKGSLLITVWKHSGTVDKTTLTAGNFTLVPPTEFHRFEALEDTVAYEVYGVDLDHDDIEREDHGE